MTKQGDDTLVRAKQVTDYIKRLCERGYSISVRYVEGRFFIYAKSTLLKYADLSCMDKDFIKCFEQMQKEDKEEARK